MTKITVSGFRWAPPFAQGLVRDLRVRWALEEANLTYDTLLIASDERDASWYRKMHPFGLVPAYEVDGQSLFESGAIVLQIAEGCDALMSREPSQRAKTIQWMFAALNTVEPPLDALLFIDTQKNNEEWAKLRRPSLVELVKARLTSLSAWLDGREYLQDRFTVADVLMTTVLRFLRHTSLVAEMQPVALYQARCEARPAFQRALAAQLAEFAQHAPAAA
jgi:glutathione S-transferase